MSLGHAPGSIASSDVAPHVGAGADAGASMVVDGIGLGVRLGKSGDCSTSSRAGIAVDLDDAGDVGHRRTLGPHEGPHRHGGDVKVFGDEEEFKQQRVSHRGNKQVWCRVMYSCTLL